MRAHIYISGFVQGVGFRHFVRNNARKLGLTGWVRNLPASPSSQGGPDNRVEAVFEGSASNAADAKEKIAEIIKLCKKGPFLSEVEDVQVLWEEAGEKSIGFEIVV